MHDDDEEPSSYKFGRREDGPGAFDEEGDGADLLDQVTSIDVIQCPHCKKYCHSEAPRCPRCKIYIVRHPDNRKPGWYVLTVVLALLLITLFWVLVGAFPRF